MSRSSNSHSMSVEDKLKAYALPHAPCDRMPHLANLKYSHTSWRNVLPVKIATYCLIAKIFAPLIIGVLAVVITVVFRAWQTGVMIMCTLLAYLCLLDNQFQVSVLRWYGAVKPGFYCRDTPLNKLLTAAMPPYSSTPWVYNGELQTICPRYFYPRAQYPNYKRYYVKSRVAFGPSNRRRKTHDPDVDFEAAAIDWAFPKTGHDPFKAIYLILHGLVGDSQHYYVLDFINEVHKQGHTVAVMISRGLMNTETTTDSIFNGATVEDVHAGAHFIRTALASTGERIIGVGFSMGGVRLANYMAMSGADCALDGGVTLCSSLDMRLNIDYKESKYLWQTIFTLNLKREIITPALHKVLAPGTPVTEEALERAWTLSKLDATVTVPYFGYKDLLELYGDASAADKLHNLAKPLLMLSAANDPIISHLTYAPYVKDTEAMNENLVVYITHGGGHNGYPAGNNLSSDNWRSYQANVVQRFTDALCAHLPPQIGKKDVVSSSPAVVVIARRPASTVVDEPPTSVGGDEDSVEPLEPIMPPKRLAPRRNTAFEIPIDSLIAVASSSINRSTTGSSPPSSRSCSSTSTKNVSISMEGVDAIAVSPSLTATGREENKRIRGSSTLQPIGELVSGGLVVSDSVTTVAVTDGDERGLHEEGASYSPLELPKPVYQWKRVPFFTAPRSRSRTSSSSARGASITDHA